MHIAWTEIESFHNVRKSILAYPHLLGGRSIVRYRGKVKLHGTNAAIQVRGDQVHCQSRTQMIGVGSDNNGFAVWVNSVKDEWIRIGSSPVRAARDLVKNGFVVFGEWCGPGIQSGVAVSQIPKKLFAVFAVQFLDAHGKGTDQLLIEPDNIMEFLHGSPVFDLTDVKVIPWVTDVIDIDFSSSTEELQSKLDDINADIKEIEAVDPFIKAEFGIEGIGEGIVYYPLSHPGREHFGNLCFKAKGEKHKTVAKAKPAQLDPSVAESAKEFAAMVLPFARLEQGAMAVARGELKFEHSLIGPFLKWINTDILKECQSEMTASGIEQKLAMKSVSEFARNWYLGKVKSL